MPLHSTTLPSPVGTLTLIASDAGLVAVLWPDDHPGRVRLGEAMRGWQGCVASVDVNPVMVLEKGGGALAVDALVELADACAKAG